MVFFGQLKLIRGGRLAAGIPGIMAVLATAYTSDYGEVFFSRCGYHSSNFFAGRIQFMRVGRHPSI